MVGLRINKRPFWYALFVGHKPTYDAYGNENGNTLVYSAPVRMLGNISPSKGNTYNNLFGIDVDYSRVINPLPKDCPIDEASVLWVDKEPIIGEDGSTQTGHDYVVTAIGESIGHKAYAISRVSIADGVSIYGQKGD